VSRDRTVAGQDAERSRVTAVLTFLRDVGLRG
jgi:hypothetical protein